MERNLESGSCRRFRGWTRGLAGDQKDPLAKVTKEEA